MPHVSISNGLGPAILAVFTLTCSSVSQAQTVVFKRPPAVSQSCPYDAMALQAKIMELKNINEQLANRAKMLEVQVAAMKVVNVKPRKQAQVCKRWKNHRCTWLVRR
jgi:hypothetical protein